MFGISFIDIIQVNIKNQDRIKSGGTLATGKNDVKQIGKYLKVFTICYSTLQQLTLPLQPYE